MPARVRRELEFAVEQELNCVEENMKNKAIEIFKNLELKLLRDFADRAAAAAGGGGGGGGDRRSSSPDPATTTINPARQATPGSPVESPAPPSTERAAQVGHRQQQQQQQPDLVPAPQTPLLYLEDPDFWTYLPEGDFLEELLRPESRPVPGLGLDFAYPT